MARRNILKSRKGPSAGPQGRGMLCVFYGNWLRHNETWEILLTHWPLGDLDAILKLQISISLYWLVSSHRLRIMPWDECQGTSPMISQHWFRLWLGTVRQQAITWANVDPDLCRHTASLGHNVNYPSAWAIHWHLIHCLIVGHCRVPLTSQTAISLSSLLSIASSSVEPGTAPTKW